MEQYISRRVELSFDAATDRTNVIVDTAKIVYSDTGVPLYVMDEQGIMYNWMHIVTITPVEATQG